METDAMCLVDRLPDELDQLFDVCRCCPVRANDEIGMLLGDLGATYAMALQAGRFY
jgi:hypothetical protein